MSFTAWYCKAALLLCCLFGSLICYSQTLILQTENPNTPFVYRLIQKELRECRYAEAEVLLLHTLQSIKENNADKFIVALSLTQELRLSSQFGYASVGLQMIQQKFQELIMANPMAKSLYFEAILDFAFEVSNFSLREKSIHVGISAFHKLEDLDRRKAILARKIGVLLRLTKKFPESMVWLQKAAKLDCGPCEESARLWSELAYTAIKNTALDTVSQLFEKAKFILNHCPTISPEDEIALHFFYAEYYRKNSKDSLLSKHVLEEAEYRAAIQIGKNNPQIRSNLLYQSYNRLANLQSSIMDFAGAIPNAKQYLDGTLARGVFPKAICEGYSNLGYHYHYLGKNEDALHCYRQAALSNPRNNEDLKLLYITQLHNLGQELMMNDDFQGGEEIIREAMKEQILLKPNDYSDLGIFHQNLGYGYELQNCPKDAVESYFQAIAMHCKASQIMWEEVCYARIQAAKSLAILGRVAEAEKQVKTGFLEMANIASQNRLGQSKLLEAIADYYYEQGNYEEALQINLRFMQAVSGGQTFDRLQFPDLLQSPAPWQSLSAATQKSKILLGLYAQSLDTLYLQASLQGSQNALLLLRKLRQEHNNEAEKLKVNAHWHCLFDYAMQAAMTLHERTKDENYLHLAFEISEQSKAMMLLEAVLDNNLLEQDISNKSLTEERRLTQAQIMRLQEGINAMKLGSPELVNLQSALFQEEKNLESIMQRIRSSNPKYSEVVSSFDVVKVAELQPILANQDRALVEYFWGDSAVYTFVLNGMNFYTHQFKLTSIFQQTLDSLTLTMQNAPLTANPTSTNTLARLSTLVYDAIWRPIANLLPKRVYVIPDGPLCFISFEAIVDSISPRENLKIQDLHFLLERHDISYNYSGTFCSQKVKPSLATNRKLLTMAPSFGVNSGLSSLDQAESDLAEITAQYESASALGNKNATKSRFLTEAPRSEIVDLATHGIFDRKNFLDSRIYFTPEGNGDSILALSELYTLNLQCRLAILEACETGFGDYRQGEGVMSMARAFTYAGCRSVLMSLWAVAEGKSTSMIIGGFYEKLADSIPIDEAIAASKRQYLVAMKANGGASLQYIHPYYWSELVLIGENAPIYLKRKPLNNWVIWAAIVTAGLCGTMLFWRNKVRKRQKSVSLQD